ncbi:hypothetical protein [Mesorhizobium sp.]|uniref:hypothetical protein n=1 Tax=Mesorhizobium sp. TaxID=1871066 RepID=UPI000FE50677|nr:hypothetical protein [Mesorhizobium sp.]RWP05111.1 MAG: hypothetical protein EOQ99_16710 [Mesorhizobium sp.]
MATKDIIAAASNPTYYTRVAFIALKAAQNVAAEDPATANHANRVAYAGRVMTGEDKALLLALHIAASNATIAGTLESSGGDAVPDGDIEYAMGQIWDARANAYA